jgi:hypothetical protein
LAGGECLEADLVVIGLGVRPETGFARNMLGAGLRFDAVPYFWTIQFMQRLDYVGHGSGTDDLIIRGDTEAPEFVAYCRRDGRILAAAGWNRDQDMAALITLLAEKRDWTIDALHPLGSSPAAVLAARAIGRNRPA